MRKLLLATAGAIVLAMAASPVAAMPQEAWTAFLEHSYAPYRSEDDAMNWEDRLFAAGEGARRPDAAIARFGRDIGATPEQARVWADAIAASAILRENCRPEGCEAWSGYGYEAVIAAGMAEPSGQLLEAVGRNLSREYGFPPSARFIDAVFAHPKKLEIFRSLYDYNRDKALLVALLIAEPGSALVLEALRQDSAEVSGSPDSWDGWYLAALEGALERLTADGAPLESRAVYAQAIMARYLNLGLNEQAVALWRGWPEPLRQGLPLAADACVKTERETPPQCVTREVGRGALSDLAAALWLAGDHDEARAVLAQVDARLGAPQPDDLAGSYGALLEALEPRIADADLYDRLVSVDQPDAPHRLGEARGWAFSSYVPAVRELVTARVRAGGYSSIANLMARKRIYYRQPSGGQLAAMPELMAPYTARREILWGWIEAAWAAHPGEDAAPRPFTGSYRPEGWTETALPPGVTPWVAPTRSDDEVYDEPEPVRLPAGVARPPVPVEAILRHQVIDGESVILFASSEFDLSGEIPAPGLWMARTEGGRWREPSYLGLQMHFPYVPTPGSGVPLIENGRVRIETQVREIDTRTITFPPVGLDLLRQEDGVVIERDLADLEQDGDADGMTDIAERRLLLDPADPDSDGDGLADGLDPMPLTARAPAVRNARFELAAAIVQHLTGHDAGAIMMPAQAPVDLDDALAAMAGAPTPAPRMLSRIMVGDPTMFSGLQLPFRLLVYTPEQAARLGAGPAPFLPPVVDIYSSLDDRQHLVIWSAGWVGGQFVVTCADAATDSCEVKELSSWIT